MSQIRKRLTYANVMSSIAVFLVLGGATAFAASSLGKNTVGSKQLKKEAVAASKIKNGAVTGAKIAAGAVGSSQINTTGLVVPTATNATNAANATHAVTADNAGHASTADNAGHASTADVAGSVNGATISKINYRVPASAGAQVVFNGGGLVITADCNGEAPKVVATTSKQDSSIYVDVLDIGSTITHADLQSGEFDTTSSFSLLAGKGGNNDLSQFEYDAVDGAVVTGSVNTDTDGALNGCRVTGTATTIG